MRWCVSCWPLTGCTWRSERLLPLECRGHFLARKITTGGTFRLRDRPLHLASPMVDQHVRLEDLTTASGRSTATPSCWRPSTNMTA